MCLWGTLWGRMEITDIVLTKLLPSVVSGAGAGISAVLAWVKGVSGKVEDISKRLHKLETVIGSLETRSGMAKSLHELEEVVRNLRGRSDETGRFDREPTGKWRTLSANDDDPRVEWRLRDVDERLQRIESKLKGFVSEEEFDKADRRRADEIQGVRTTLAEIRGLLYGLQSALGLIKPGRRGGSDG